MRFGGRERDIVLALLAGPASGSELAKKFNVSRRTILRDINRANAVLARYGAGVIESDPTYRLTVSSQDALNDLLSSVSDDETEVLLALLCRSHSTLNDIADQTGLPVATVRSCLSSIEQDYGRILQLNVRAARGIDIEFKRSNAADLVAALAERDRAVRSEVAAIAAPWISAEGLASQEIQSFQFAMDPWLTSQQARLQIDAAIATTPFETGDMPALATVKASINALVARKSDLHAWLLTKRNDLLNLISELLASHGVAMARTDLPLLMYEHVARSAMFPTLMTDEFQEQVSRIRLEHPIEFDFAKELCDAVESMRPDVFIEYGLCALYAIGTGLRRDRPRLSILMLCGRRSLESLNRAMLEQSLDNAVVTSVFDVDAALRDYRSDTFDLFVRDDSFTDERLTDIPWDLVCRGIISDSDIAMLRRKIADASYRSLLPQMLPPDAFVKVAVGGQNYLEVVAQGLDELQEKGIVGHDEAELVLNREREGQCLRFNGVAVPHCVTPVPSDEPRLFVLSLDEPVLCEGEAVSLVIVVLVSKSLDDKSSIFSYLYSALGSGPGVEPGISYEELIKALGAYTA